MDPLTAIGLASAVISFVDLGAKIAKRVEELSKAGDLPGVFGDIKTRIPLIMSIVKRIEGSREALAPDTNAAFDSVIENCNHQIKQLEAILNKVKVAPGDSTLKKGYIALSSLVLEMRVQRISATLKDNFQILTTFKVTHTEERRPSIFGSSIISSPGKYTDSQAVFAVPFVRDASFVGREGPLTEIEDLFNRGGEVAVVGVGGVGYDSSLLPARAPQLTPSGNRKSLLSMPIATTNPIQMRTCCGSMEAQFLGSIRVSRRLPNV